MKCTKCGEEIKTGNLYCSKCGAEVQIVSAYNVMEDEFFLDFQNHEMGVTGRKRTPDPSCVIQKKNLYICTLVALIGFFVLLVVAFLVRMNAGKIPRVYEQRDELLFVQALADADMKEAEDFLLQKLADTPDNLNGRFWLAWFYGREGKQEKQIETLQQILSLDDENVYACRELIRVYVEAEDFEGLHAFYKACADTKLTALFADYLVEIPEIEVPSELLHAGDTLTIRAKDGLNVYYTLDGSSPITNGTLYYAPIRLEAGTYTLQATACNEAGYFSPVVSQELTVEQRYQLGMPRVTPNSGEYLSPQTIYVNVPEGCTAYYTWNGSNPTTASSKYNGGISMREGNNVLSVILVDAYGNVSSVQRVNYIYMPQ